MVLTLRWDAIAAITWFADTGVFRHFDLAEAMPPDHASTFAMPR
jgi:hypothetical protein